MQSNKDGGIIMEIRDESIIPFLKENLLNPPNLDERSSVYADANAHSILSSKTIRFKKLDCGGIGSANKVKFLLKDSTQNTDDKIFVVYTFNIESYDDYSLLLTKESRESELLDKNIK